MVVTGNTFTFSTCTSLLKSCFDQHNRLLDKVASVYNNNKQVCRSPIVQIIYHRYIRGKVVKILPQLCSELLTEFQDSRPLCNTQQIPCHVCGVPGSGGGGGGGGE